MEQSEVKVPSVKELPEIVVQLTARIEALEKKIEELTKPKNEAQREMTDDDAKRILTGDMKDLKHKDAAEKLGLSYGQIYSCRFEHTFKHVHKALKAEGFKNSWVK